MGAIVLAEVSRVGCVHQEATDLAWLTHLHWVIAWFFAWEVRVHEAVRDLLGVLLEVDDIPIDDQVALLMGIWAQRHEDDHLRANHREVCVHA